MCKKRTIYTNSNSIQGHFCPPSHVMQSTIRTLLHLPVQTKKNEPKLQSTKTIVIIFEISSPSAESKTSRTYP